MLADNFSSIGSSLATVAVAWLDVATLGGAAFSAARNVASSRVASLNCSVNLAESEDPPTLALPVALLPELDVVVAARFSRSARHELFGSSAVDDDAAAALSPPRSLLDAVADDEGEAENPVSVLEDTVEEPAAAPSELSDETLAQPANANNTVTGVRRRSTRRFINPTEQEPPEDGKP
jgi:hypothetical protein